MSTWDDLKVVLAQLRDDGTGALQAFPMPEVDVGRTPPFGITLAAWAVGTAASLYDRFGDELDVVVGFMRFPDCTPRHPAPTGRPSPPLLPSDQIEVSVEESIEIKSGHDGRSELHVANRGPEEVVVATNGQVTAVVVEPGTSEVVGGFAGAQHLPLVRFQVEPGESTPIPMLVGTASIAPRLGYAVPPGRWAIEVRLNLGDRGWFRTPLVPLTVIA